MFCTLIFFASCEFEIYYRGTLLTTFYAWPGLLFDTGFSIKWFVFEFSFLGDGRVSIYLPDVILFRLDVAFEPVRLVLFTWFSFYRGCSNFSFSLSYSNSFRIVSNCSFYSLALCKSSFSILFSSFTDWLSSSDSSLSLRSSAILEFKLSIAPFLSLTYC